MSMQRLPNLQIHRVVGRAYGCCEIVPGIPAAAMDDFLVQEGDRFVQPDWSAPAAAIFKEGAVLLARSPEQPAKRTRSRKVGKTR